MTRYGATRADPTRRARDSRNVSPCDNRATHVCIHNDRQRINENNVSNTHKQT